MYRNRPYMYYKLFVVFIFLSLIISGVLGANQDWNTQVKKGEVSPQSGTAEQKASLDQGTVPSERINEIGSDWVDVNRVSDQSYLTSSQLSYNGNLAKINDLSKLNYEALRQAMYEKFKVQIPRIKSISNLDMQGEKLSRLTIIYNENKHLLLPNPLSTTEKDKLIQVDGNSNSKVTYTNDNNKIKFDLENTGNLIIGNEQQRVLEFEINDSSKKGSVEIEKQKDNSLKIATNNTKNNFYSEEYNEYVYGENSEIYLDINQGIYKVIIDSPGLFKHDFKYLPKEQYPDYYNSNMIREDKTFAQGYAIQNPPEKNKYTLYIDKINHSITEFEETNQDNGYVSLISHNLQLNGIINYLRISYNREDHITSNNNNYYVISPVDASFYKVYEGKNKNNIFKGKLEDNNIYLKAELELKNYKEKEILYFLHFKDEIITETAENSEKTKWFFKWNDKLTPVSIKEFKTNTGKGNFIYNENHLTLKNNKGITIPFFSKREAYEEKDFAKNKLLNYFNEYNQKNSQCLNQASSHYFTKIKEEEKTLINWVKEGTKEKGNSVIELNMPYTYFTKEEKENYLLDPKTKYYKFIFVP